MIGLSEVERRALPGQVRLLVGHLRGQAAVEHKLRADLLAERIPAAAAEAEPLPHDAA